MAPSGQLTARKGWTSGEPEGISSNSRTPSAGVFFRHPQVTRPSKCLWAPLSSDEETVGTGAPASGLVTTSCDRNLSCRRQIDASSNDNQALVALRGILNAATQQFDLSGRHYEDSSAVW